MSEAKSPLSRRKVVAGAGTAGAVAAAASLLPIGAPQAPQAGEAATKARPDARPGYRLTAHVERYYQTAKV